MTTIQTEEVTCGVCGKETTQISIGSTSIFGPPDLDSRPAEMQRSTIKYWVHRCPRCGYCGSSIQDGDPSLKPFLKTHEYLAQSKKRGIPRLARDFLCTSMLEEHTDNLRAAAWSLIFAAWVCDDEQLSERASDCRKRAYELIQRIQVAGDPWMPQPGADVVMGADLLRRAGLFDEAENLIGAFERADDVDDVINKLISFELELVKARDSACHTLAEVVA